MCQASNQALSGHKKADTDGGVTVGDQDLTASFLFPANIGWSTQCKCRRQTNHFVPVIIERNEEHARLKVSLYEEQKESEHNVA